MSFAAEWVPEHTIKTGLTQTQSVAITLKHQHERLHIVR